MPSITGTKYIRNICYPIRTLDLGDLTIIGAAPHGDDNQQCSQKWKISLDPHSSKQELYIIQNTLTENPKIYLSVDSVTKPKNVIVSIKKQSWIITSVGTDGESGDPTSYMIQLPQVTDSFCSLQSDTESEPVVIRGFNTDQEKWKLEDVLDISIEGLKYIQSVGHDKRTTENFTEDRVEGWEQHEPHKPCSQKWKITKSGERYVLLNDKTNKYLGINDGGDKAIAVDNKDYWNISLVHYAPTPRFTIQNEKMKGFCSLQSGDEGSPVKLLTTEQPSPNEEWFLVPA